MLHVSNLLLVPGASTNEEGLQNPSTIDTHHQHEETYKFMLYVARTCSAYQCVGERTKVAAICISDPDDGQSRTGCDTYQ